MKNPSLSRQERVQNLLDSLSLLKRGMYAHLQATNKLMPIPRAQLELLAAVQQTQPISSKELARQLYLTPGAVSQLAESLEHQELISRKADPNDRRIQCLSTTRKGEKLLRDVDKRRRANIEAVLAGLTDEELEVWCRVQQKLLAQFQSEAIKDTEKENKA
jgi:DNA-binding MarR family transcriptional regulator